LLVSFVGLSRFVLLRWSFHDVDSNEMAFKIAASSGVRKGALMLIPVFLDCYEE